MLDLQLVATPTGNFFEGFTTMHKAVKQEEAEFGIFERRREKPKEKDNFKQFANRALAITIPIANTQADLSSGAKAWSMCPVIGEVGSEARLQKESFKEDYKNLQIDY